MHAQYMTSNSGFSNWLDSAICYSTLCNIFTMFLCIVFLLLCMKGDTLTLHPPFEKSGYGPGVSFGS